MNGNRNAGRLPVITFIVFGILGIACQSSSQPSVVADEWAPGFPTNKSDPHIKDQIELPVLTPCPEGWNRVQGSTPDEVDVCEPWSQLPISQISPVSMVPCPEGWREKEYPSTGVLVCEPFPEEGSHDCAEEEAHFLGEPTCSRIGTSCPAGDWANNLPTDKTIIYVRADEPPGGDGSRVSPYSTITEAVEAAGNDVIIALSKGTFDESVILRESLVLWGACVSETIVTQSVENSSHGTVNVEGSHTGVRNLRISGEGIGISLNGFSYSIHVEDVLIKQARAYGFQIVQGQASLSNVVIRGTRSNKADLTLGIGLDAHSGAKVVVHRTLLQNNRYIGIFARHANTQLDLNDVVIQDTQSQQSDQLWGVGLYVHLGAKVDVHRALFQNNRDIGVFANHSGTQLMLNHVVLRDTQSRESNKSNGRGLNAQEGASIEISRSLFEMNRDVAIFAFQEGTQLVLNDVVIRDTLGRENDQGSGTGLQLQDGAGAEVHRAFFQNNRYTSMFVDGANTQLDLNDVVVRDTQSQQNDGNYGNGLHVQSGASVSIQRSLFQNNRFAGIRATEEGTQLTLNDVVIRDTQSQQSDGRYGQGLSIEYGAKGEVSQTLLEKNRAVGVLVMSDGTQSTFKNVVIRDTRSRASDQTGGHGFSIQQGAIVDVHTALFEKNRTVGVVVAHEGTQLTLNDVVIRDTQPMELELKEGLGIVALEGANIEAHRLLLQNNTEFGIRAMTKGTQLTLNDVIIRDTQPTDRNNKIGIGVSVEEDAQVEITGAVIERNIGRGLVTFGTNTKVVTQDIIVRHTLDTSQSIDGVGVSAMGGSHIQMNNFLVSYNDLCGIQISYGATDHDDGSQTKYEEGGTIDLYYGEISNNAICGANVQTEDFDISRLTDKVYYLDNNYNNIDSNNLSFTYKDTGEIPLGI